MRIGLLAKLVLLLGLAWGSFAWSQNDENEKPASRTTDNAAAGSQPEAQSSDVTQVESAEQPATPSSTNATATMERFDPSEKVSEDRSVSFPVDI